MAIITAGGYIAALILFIEFLYMDEIEKFLNGKPKYDNYVLFQPNPIKRDTNDCSIRAISKLLNISWYEAFDTLNEFARKYADQANNSCNINTVLHEKLKMGVFVPKNEITFEKFAHLHPSGTYALHTRSHICALIDGKLYDSWDCRKEKVYFYNALSGSPGDSDVTFDGEHVNSYYGKQKQASSKDACLHIINKQNHENTIKFKIKARNII